MSNMTIAQAQTRFLESVGTSHRLNTLQTYRKALETFTHMLEARHIYARDLPVAELTEESLVHFVNYLKELSPATENLYLQVIKSFFIFLDAEHLATINLSRSRMLIKQHSRQSRRQPAEYPERELLYLIQFMSNLSDGSQVDRAEVNGQDLRLMRDRALILTLADTGLRPDELCKLQCGDIDCEGKRAVLKGRGNKEAVVRFSTRSIDAIQAYLSLRKSLDLETGQVLTSLPLFARHDKGTGNKIKLITPTTLRNIVAERVHQALGEDAVGMITPHTFMHYFVTTILRATGNLKLAQVLARHSSIQATQRYAHINDDELDKGYYEIFEKRDK